MTEQAFESVGLEHEPARTTHHAPRKLIADASLLLVALVWGATFVMVKDAVSALPVFSFMAIRFVFATAALTPLVLWRRRQLAAAAPAGPFAGGVWLRPARLARIALPSLLIGGALFAGYAFQTTGLQLTTPAKAGFITGLSVVIVPLVSAVILRRSPAPRAWAGVGLAVGGLALLSLQAGLRIETGDLLVLGCAFSFAAHILLTGHLAPRHDPLLLTLGQIVTVLILSAAAALIFDVPAAGLSALVGRIDARSSALRHSPACWPPPPPSPSKPWRSASPPPPTPPSSSRPSRSSPGCSVSC